MTNHHFFIAMVLTAIFFLTACEKDDPVIPNEEELITTLTYTLTPSGGVQPLH